MPETIIVIPCYNEEKRIDLSEYAGFLKEPSLGFLFVDDGSRDNTGALLGDLTRRFAGKVNVIRLNRNSGKAEAVRRGLSWAVAQGVDIVGYIDADLATPVPDVLNLLHELRRRPCQVVMGSRVALSGRHIDRVWMRHYLGRVFSTASSLILRATIYDTQCGAKFFKNSQAFQAAIAVPFHSTWAFDVEFLGRLLVGTIRTDPIPADQIIEIPLERWRDVSGSKLSCSGMIRAGIDLVLIHRDLTRRRREKAMAERLVGASSG